VTQPESTALAEVGYAAFADYMNATAYAVGRWEDLPAEYQNGYEVMCQAAVAAQLAETPPEVQP
jgi:hypothetical protein